MKKRKKYLKVFINVIIIVIVLYISTNINRPYTKFEMNIKDLVLPINKLLLSPKENTTNQTESYLIQKNINTTLEKEIKELKDTLKLKSTHTEFEVVNATVISRNSIHWLNTLTIDKGQKDGLKEGMAVITVNGLVGKISKVTKNSSEIKLITSNDVTYKTSVVMRIDEKDYYAILNGYDEKMNLLKLTAIDKNINTKKGDIVLTSGLGNMPKGIYIGTIVTFKTDEYDLSKTIYVETKQDFSSINYVSILKENN